MKPRKLPDALPPIDFKSKRTRTKKGKQAISVRLAIGTKARIAQLLNESGLSIKSKSMWINDTLRSYLQNEHWLAMTAPIARFEPAVMTKDSEYDQFALDLDVWIQTWEAAVTLTRWFYEHEHEALQPDLSMICRSAIAHAIGRHTQDA